MPDDLRPPESCAHFRWHWIGRNNDPVFPAFWTGQSWHIAGERYTPEQAHQGGFRYSHPCDPAAVSINPEDAKQIKCVARVLCKIRFTPDGDGCECASGGPYAQDCGCEQMARAALKALSDA